MSCAGPNPDGYVNVFLKGCSYDEVVFRAPASSSIDIDDILVGWWKGYISGTVIAGAVSPNVFMN